MSLCRRWRVHGVQGIKGHPGLEVSGLGFRREEGRVIVHTPPTRYLTLSFIGIFTFLFILLFISLTVPSSFLITHVYFRWVHPELVEPRYGVSPFQVFTKQIEARPPFFQQTVPGFLREVRESIYRLPSKALSYRKEPIYP